MQNMKQGATYEWVQSGTFQVFSWDENFSLTTFGVDVPAGTRFTVEAAYWMPPGMDVVPEVKVTTDAPLRQKRGERERTISVGRAVLDLGHVREVGALTVDILVQLRINEATWRGEYGVSDVDADVRSYFADEVMRQSLSDRKAFGPVAEVITATISKIA